METDMNTFDWYGNRVARQPTSNNRTLRVHKALAFAWLRLGLGLIGENMSD